MSGLDPRLIKRGPATHSALETLGALQTAPQIAMQPVKSSNVTALGYDEPTKTMAVTFSSGGTYHYDDVPREVFDGLMKADSKGAYLAGVRSRFPSRRVDTPKDTAAPKPNSAWPFPSR